MATFLLKSLELRLSDSKTKVTNISLSHVSFLGANIKLIDGGLASRMLNGTQITQRIGRRLSFEAPMAQIRNKLANSGFIIYNRPGPKLALMANHKDSIIDTYNAVFRGYINYYSFANNRGRLVSFLYYVL